MYGLSQSGFLWCAIFSVRLSVCSFVYGFIAFFWCLYLDSNTRSHLNGKPIFFVALKIWDLC